VWPNLLTLSRSRKKCWLSMAEFHLTPAAEGDLEEIWTFTCQQWDMEQANRYIDRLTDAFDDLAHSPMTAPSCDHIRLGYRR